jgi:glycosyltransferase involved in cell wall biosynthesis
MKILQVIQFFSPKFGGSVNVVYNLSKELSQRGHDVTIIATDYLFDKSYAKSIEKEGVKVITFKCLANLASFLYSPSMVKWLNINITNFDVVHMNNFRSYQNFIVRNYAKKYNIPYVIQAHGSLLPVPPKKGLKKLFDIFFGYNILNDATNFIALTKKEFEEYTIMGCYEDKIKIVPNGINLSEYQNLPERGEFRKKYDINNNKKVILYVGRIHKLKGIDLLIQSFSEILKDFKSVKLAIIGPDDGFLSFLKSLVKDLKIESEVLFTGPLYGKDKLEAYCDADVCVLPSIREGFPTMVLESCACGTPVIITKNCGISDLGKQVGYVIDYNKKQLKDSLIESIINETPQKSLMRRELMKEEFSLEKTSNKLEVVYNSINEK